MSTMYENGRRAAENFDGWNAVITQHEEAGTELDWPLYELAMLVRHECRKHVEAALCYELRDGEMLRRLNADISAMQDEMDVAELAR